MVPFISITDLARANTYKMYLCGNAYIPLQDMEIYKDCYDKVFNYAQKG